MECGSCAVDYDEEGHEPRALKCGHSCCSVCLFDMVDENDVVCPTCNSVQETPDEDDMPINHGILQLLQLMREKLETAASSRKSMSPVPCLSAGICEDHGSHKVFYCTICTIWVCRDCTITDHVQPCRIVSAKQAVNDLKAHGEGYISSELSLRKQELDILGKRELTLGSTIDDYKDHDARFERIQEIRKELLNRVQEQYQKCTQQQTVLKCTITRLEKSLQDIKEVNTVDGLLKQLAIIQNTSTKNKTQAEGTQEQPILQTYAEVYAKMDNVLTSMYNILEIKPEAELNPEVQPEAELNPEVQPEAEVKSLLNAAEESQLAAEGYLVVP